MSGVADVFDSSSWNTGSDTGSDSIASQIIGSITQLGTAGIIASQANGQPVGFNNGQLSIGTGYASPLASGGQNSLLLIVLLIVVGFFAFRAIE